ncbi:MAG: type IX secretion system protein PorQ [Prevotella sp.]|nr:type IX secretion system protein PorQ [Prevotella sp.]
MKKFLFTLLLTMLVSATRAQESQTVYNFLRLPMSGHAAALGGDNISIVEDDEALIFNNPALLSSVNDKTISLSYMNYMQGSNSLGAAFNRTLTERASAGVSGQYINYGSMKEVDENNIQTGDFSAKDIAVAGYFSYLLTDRLSGGITAKFIASYIGQYSSVGVGVDLGLNYYDPEREWSVSAVAKNLGGQLSAYEDEYERLPIDVQIGVSKRLVHTPLRFSATLVGLNHWDDYKFIDHLVGGIDLILSQQIWVGMGYNFRRAHEMRIGTGDEESSHGAGLSFGAGLQLERFKLNLAYGKYHVSSSSLVISTAFNI